MCYVSFLPLVKKKCQKNRTQRLKEDKNEIRISGKQKPTKTQSTGTMLYNMSVTRLVASSVGHTDFFQLGCDTMSLAYSKLMKKTSDSVMDPCLMWFQII